MAKAKPKTNKPAATKKTQVSAVKSTKAAKSAKPAAGAATKTVEPELVEPVASSGGYDPDELRAELESMREVGVDPDILDGADSVIALGGQVSREIGDDGIIDGVIDDANVDMTVDGSFEDELPVRKKRAKARGASKQVTTEVVGGAKRASRALTAADPVTIYLAELRKYPLLTKEQERELAIRYRETGDARAAELLVTSNLRFVVKIAAEYSRFGAKLIDLVQEGNVGLMHAVKEFNPYKGVRLITYAVWWIRGYIQEYLMRQYSLVRIGTTQNQRKLFYRLQKERDALGHSGQEATPALLAGRLGVTEEEVETMSQRLSGRDVSLSAPLDASGESSGSLLDFEASGGTAVDDAIGEREELAVLKENLEKIRGDLTEKELYILEKRVLADEPQTLQEIGEHYGVTREAVRQLEARLIAKIRKAVTSSLTAVGESDEEGS